MIDGVSARLAKRADAGVVREGKQELRAATVGGIQRARRALPEEWIRYPLVEALFGRGAVGPSETVIVASILGFYLFSIPGMGVFRLVQNFFYSSVSARAYLADELRHQEARDLLDDPDIVLVTGSWTRVEVAGALVRAAKAHRRYRSRWFRSLAAFAVARPFDAVLCLFSSIGYVHGEVIEIGGGDRAFRLGALDDVLDLGLRRRELRHGPRGLRRILGGRGFGGRVACHQASTSSVSRRSCLWRSRR